MCVILLSILLNPVVSVSAKEIIYGVSLTIKSIVLFLLPFIIFSLLFNTFSKLVGNGAALVCLIFGVICTSNFINTFVSHYVGKLFYCLDFNIKGAVISGQVIKPYFILELPNVIKNEFALLGGVLSGACAPFILSRDLLQLVQSFLDKLVKKLFGVISTLIPLFIVGYVIKCASEGSLPVLIRSYSFIFVVFIAYASLYTILFYLFSTGWNWSRCFTYLSNMLPAFLTGISTISSALTMPVTMMSVEKNVKNKELAGSVVSATVNIHLLGDCIAIPLLAYSLMKHFGMAEPTLYSYFIFTIFFVIAKFSVAAVPAGGIIVMTPILEKYLGFTTDMSSLIIAIYIIFDPLITGFNVLGNGALAKVIDNLYTKFLLRKKSV